MACKKCGGNGGHHKPGCGISSILIPPINWTGMQNIFDVIWTVNNDNTTVKIQTSVNWPARGTYYCRATSYLMLIKVCTLHPQYAMIKLVI